VTRAMVVDVEKIEADSVLFRNRSSEIRVKFADNWLFTKEESADLFRPFQGKQAVLPVDEPFFIALDFRPNLNGKFDVQPMYLAVASIERS
jgi:hypothetical protein